MICENVSSNYTSISNNVGNGINSNDDNVRTDYTRRDSFSHTTSKDIDSKKNDDIHTTNVIYRYKFTEEFIVELYKFSKIHQYDERKDFKEAWNIWIEEEEDLINEEIKRLISLRYEGDILDKMFKSARYYFRKKSTAKKTPIARRSYVPVRKELLECIDKHIKTNINNDDYKPSEGFTQFCRDYIELLKEEVAILCKTGFNNSEEIRTKFKKTYKNRYFIMTTK